MRTREKDVRVRLSEKEYNTILNNAKKLNMKIAPYIRMASLNPNIIKYNYEIIREHSKEIGKVRETINHLIFSIEASNNYLPEEIDEIVKLMNEIFKIENNLREELRKERIRQYNESRKTQKEKN